MQAFYVLHVCTGEGAGVASLASDASNAFANAYLNVDIPLDGIGLISIPAAEIISPVFTLWITLVIMYMGAYHAPFFLKIQQLNAVFLLLASSSLCIFILKSAWSPYSKVESCDEFSSLQHIFGSLRMCVRVTELQ